MLWKHVSVLLCIKLFCIQFSSAWFARKSNIFCSSANFFPHIGKNIHISCCMILLVQTKEKKFMLRVCWEKENGIIIIILYAFVFVLRKKQFFLHTYCEFVEEIEKKTGFFFLFFSSKNLKEISFCLHFPLVVVN